MWWRIVRDASPTFGHRPRQEGFVAGLRVENGVVEEVAPILSWTRGHSWAWVKGVMTRYNWRGAPF